MRVILLLLALWGMGIFRHAIAQGSIGTTRVLFVADFSLSMGGKWEKRPKIVVLREALEKTVQKLQKEYPDVEVGLRLFGHKSPKHWNDCRDTRLEVPIGKGNHKKISEKLNMYEPRGVTPLAYTLQQVRTDFPSSQGRNIVILFTDGAESCEGDPCAVLNSLKSKNITIKPFIIGINLDMEALNTLACAGGSVYNAEKEADLEIILQKITERIVALSSVTVELLDENNRPVETNLPMIFYDSGDKSVRYVFFHTLNAEGKPDTLYLDPVFSYDLYVYSTPLVSKKNIKLIPGQHNVIKVKVPTGYIETKLQHVTIEADVQGKLTPVIRDVRTQYLVDFTNPNDKRRYLAQNYDLEILTVPTINIRNVNVSSAKTTKVEIPAPGVLILDVMYEGIGSILMRTKDGVQKIYEIPTHKRRQIIALQPGEYIIVYKPNFAKRSMDTRTKTFKIVSNQSVRITLN